jgi:hypothetical protein
MEDDRVAILESQLAQAKLIAEEADKKYEEVRFEPSHKDKLIFFARRRPRPSGGEARGPISDAERSSK